MSDTSGVFDQWGTNIAQARLARGLTQEVLARTLGVAPMTISRYETGGFRPSLELQIRLAHELGVSVTELFPRTDDEAELVAIAARLGNGCS